MRRTSFSDMSCSIARTLEQVGEWWTLLIIREAFWGTRRFGEFQAHLNADGLTAAASPVTPERLAGLIALKL